MLARHLAASSISGKTDLWPAPQQSELSNGGQDRPTRRREHARPFCRIGHSGIFFLKKLPITIKIRFIASPMITVTRLASVTSRRSCSWTGNRYSPLRMSWWQWFVTTIVGPTQMKVRRAPPVTRTSSSDCNTQLPSKNGRFRRVPQWDRGIGAELARSSAWWKVIRACLISPMTAARSMPASRCEVIRRLAPAA